MSSLQLTKKEEKFINDLFTKLGNIKRTRKSYAKTIKLKKTNANMIHGGSPITKSSSNVDLVVPLRSDVIDSVETLHDIAHKSGVKRIIIDSDLSNPQMVNDFKKHIMDAITKLETGNHDVKLSSTDLQLLSMFVAFKDLKNDTSTMAQQVSQQSTSKSKSVSAAMMAVDSTMHDISTLDEMYLNGTATNLTIEMFTTIINLMSRLCGMMQVLKQSRVTNFLIGVCSFIVITLSKLILIVIQSTLGKLFMMGMFVKLYRESNPYAVFIGNAAIKVGTHLITRAGLSTEDIQAAVNVHLTKMGKSMEQYVIDNLPKLITIPAISSFFSSIINTSLSSPEIIKSLGLQIGSNINVAPAINGAVASALNNAGPELVSKIMDGTTTAVNKVMSSQIPLLMEGVTTTVELTMQNVGINSLAPAIQNAVSAAVQTSTMNTMTSQMVSTAMTPMLKYGFEMIGNYMGVYGAGEAVGLLTNHGGSTNTMKVTM